MKQVLYFLSLGVFLHSCKSKETVTPNSPPSAFTVTQTLKSDGKTIVLNWTKAKDPDGDAVTYAVVLKDTLVKNISETTYTIASLDFNYSQAGKIIAKDTKGLTSEVSFTAVTKVQTFVNIPDANFEKYLVEQKIDKDGLVNVRMDVEDAKGVKTLNLYQRNIKSLIGIEYFLDLTKLLCYNNQLTTLDISKNLGLDTLDCSKNQLSLIDLSQNVALRQLECLGNQITNLDLSKNINLLRLGCGNNNLKTLDMSKNISIKSLFCDRNQIVNLDVSKLLLLEYFSVAYNLLLTLDVSTNVRLTNLFCHSNQLTNLDISKNINLDFFWCDDNKIKIICVNNVSKANSFGFPNWIKDPTATYEVCK